MKVLVIGSGGREHSIVQKLLQSDQVSDIYVAPGNGGIATQATCVAIQQDDIAGLIRFAKQEQMEWTIVGPEIPLNAGVVDAFNKEGLNIFGPSQAAALLEGSKDFAKGFMKKYEIPTAAYQTFTEIEAAKAYLIEKGAPIVIKADGLAAGKGVVVATTLEQAMQAVESMLLDNCFGSAGSRVVIEEFLAGKEFSLMAFVHGENVYPLLPARDHKRAYDNDQGPNTGGMGAFAPVPDLDPAIVTYAIEHILKPTAKGMIAEGRSFTGILYGGLIETAAGPKVIEFNARLGDPETQVVLPLLENDLIQVIDDVMKGNDPKLRWKQGYAIGTVLASKGYPGIYSKEAVLPPLPASESCYVVHAGTKAMENGSFQAIGGRVLLVGSVQQTMRQASEAVYMYVNQ